MLTFLNFDGKGSGGVTLTFEDGANQYVANVEVEKIESQCLRIK